MPQPPPRPRRTPSQTASWFRSNTRVLTPVAEVLHSLALLTPSPHAEFRAQLAATLLSLIQLYRDYPLLESLSHPTRRLALSFLNAVQLLVEMSAVRSAPSLHWPLITAMESFKALLRLSILPSIAPLCRPLLPSDQNVPQTPVEPDCVCGLRDVPHVDEISVHKGPRNDRAILRLLHDRMEGSDKTTTQQDGQDDDPILDALFLVAYERRNLWLLGTFMPSLRCTACHGVIQHSTPPLSNTLSDLHQTLSRVEPTEILSDVLYILRPVIHLLLIRRLGWRSWRAWSFALSLDLASRLAMRRRPAGVEAEAEEAEEVFVERRRRMAQLCLYLGRSPLFDLILRMVVTSITSPLRRVPVVGSVTCSAIQWITLLQQYWFYTSAS